ncbi:MAG: NAD(P)H-hydrate dehydratase [Ignavibacteria bacterium]
MKNVFFKDKVLPAEKKIISSLRIHSRILMENAGANSAGYIIHNYPDLFDNPVIIITGKGNNAGDGFVTARHLFINNVSAKILTLFMEAELKGDALENYNLLKNLLNGNSGILYCKDVKDLKKEIPDETGIVIDAVFGVGFKGELGKRIGEMFVFLNGLKNKFRISLDTPYGLYSFNQKAAALKAGLTLAMGVKKFDSLFGEGRKYSGNIQVIDIGVDDNEFTKYNSDKIFETGEDDVRKFLPVRDINSNKYSNGKVFILSGSKGLTGAAYLCSMSAMRTGCGAVVTGVPASINDIMEIKMTEVMTLPLKETSSLSLSLNSYEEMKDRLKWADTILIGPGISKNEETMKLVRKIVKENDLNYVIDADAISAFKGHLKLLKNKKIILTPHFGEFANLIDKDIEEVKSNFYVLAKDFAKEYKIVLILKNAPSIITDGKEFYINPTGRENLATAGTGDVLSGIVAGLYSQSKNIFKSALAAAYIHGKCGDNLYDLTGPDSTIAGDLINEIPKVKNGIIGK